METAIEDTELPVKLSGTAKFCEAELMSGKLTLLLTENTSFLDCWSVKSVRTELKVELPEGVIGLFQLSTPLISRGFTSLRQFITRSGPLMLPLAWSNQLQQERPVKLMAGEEIGELVFVRLAGLKLLDTKGGD